MRSRRETRELPAAALMAGGMHNIRAPKSDSPDVDDVIAKLDREHCIAFLLLARSPDNRGSSYEWQDAAGRLICNGYEPGSIYAVKVAAVEHLKIVRGGL